MSKSNNLEEILDNLGQAYHNNYPDKIAHKEATHAIQELIRKAEIEAGEIFIPVKGAEGHYEVSNTGKVRSVLGNRRKGVELKQQCYAGKRSKGYKTVSLVKDGKTMTARVHRLVASSFLSNPEKKPCVNHLDGDTTNNHTDNLEWCTYSENELHSHRALGKKIWNKDTAKYEDIKCIECGKVFTDRVWKKRMLCGKSCQIIYKNRKQELNTNGGKDE